MLKKMKLSKIICVGGILTAITVIFQSAPVFLPVIGMGLSPFSSLPVLLSAYFGTQVGVVVLVSSVLLTFIVSPQEAVILMFSTGPLGFAVGALLARKGVWYTTIISTITLFTGIVILTYVVGVPAFGVFSKSISLTMILFFFYFFVCLHLLLDFLR